MFDNATADAAVFCVGLNGDKAAIITHALIPLVVRLSVKRLAAVKFHFFLEKIVCISKYIKYYPRIALYFCDDFVIIRSAICCSDTQSRSSVTCDDRGAIRVSAQKFELRFELDTEILCKKGIYCTRRTSSRSMFFPFLVLLLLASENERFPRYHLHGASSFGSRIASSLKSVSVRQCRRISGDNR